MQQGEARQRASGAWVGKRRSGAHITARPPFVAFVARTCLMLSMKLFPKRLTNSVWLATLGGWGWEKGRRASAAGVSVSGGDGCGFGAAEWTRRRTFCPSCCVASEDLSSCARLAPGADDV